ncbi:hypothetical protein GTP45_11695 [Pseudoduganella sp. FT55W]|uniref:Uncharacterized protein n=1 Tax=Duganella rivi TaxID=2666083 RepID=A0A7X4KCM7_9BURK|nr:hypothetical protein [Duganella rivi]MYM67493.1 hypothetical protein [Duganella rivi]
MMALQGLGNGIHTAGGASSKLALPTRIPKKAALCAGFFHFGAGGGWVLMMIGIGGIAGVFGVALFSTKVITVIAATLMTMAVPTTQRMVSLALR